MIRSMGAVFSRVAQRFLPDAFIFAVLLAIITFILGMAVQGASFLEMTSYFGEGIWGFLTFAMQMVLILVTGSALATSRPVRRLLKAVAGLARTPGQAIVIATAAMIVCCWVNWGFGLIVSALLARELARNVRGVHYPLLVASAYSGFIVWHAGFSGSIPLKIAGADAIMHEFAGGAVVPASQTIFAWQNIALVLVFLVTIPLLNRLMAPRGGEEIVEIDPSLLGGEEHCGGFAGGRDTSSREMAPGDPGAAASSGGGPGRKAPAPGMTPAERIENSPVLSIAIGAVLCIYIVRYFMLDGAIGLNIVNLIFLTLGILMHGTPIRYVGAINMAVRACGGIILQFPFYAGIMGMMMGSGLAATLSQGFVGISNQTTFPFFTYLSAGIVNFFVPSGGGQWAVQGPIMMPASEVLGVPLAKTAMAIAWGDAWTNLVQPFWALPLLAVAGLSIRDIMGYTAVILIFSGLITSLFMFFAF